MKKVSGRKVNYIAAYKEVSKEGVGRITEDRWTRRAHNYECVNKETDEVKRRLKKYF